VTVTPIFLLSLPRSGSTLVQRVLAHHDDVSTSSETWLLLPLLSTLRPRIPFAGGWHRGNRIGLEDFAKTLPDGLETYRRTVRSAALALYADAAGPGATFFLDKTPPYSLIVDELFDVFPDARFLFLWRHPLSVLSSIVETFCGGRWRPDDYVTSLFVGLDNLVAAYERHPGRCVGVRYEDLLLEGAPAWRRIAADLAIPFEESAIERFADVALDGWLGDDSGRSLYRNLDTAPLQKWRTTISTPVRRAWARRYLRWIGPHRLSVMGYDLEGLLDELDGVQTTSDAATRDVLDLARSFTRDVVKSQVQRNARPPSAWRYLLGSPTAGAAVRRPASERA
jgi:hypothetical protein